MAQKAPLPHLGCCCLCFLLLIAILNNNVSQAAEISVYWGQDIREGSLSSACQSGNYDIVNIGYLSTFGNGSDIELTLGDHCTPGDLTCTSKIRDDVLICQRLGVKVFLSIGGPEGDYSLASYDDVMKVVKDIWENFFVDNKSGPLGAVTLDGVDFDIQMGTIELWLDLARNFLSKFGKSRKFYLSAAPGCSFPNVFLDEALHDFSFDYVWIKFYNDTSCDYSGSFAPFISRWGRWREHVLSQNLFLGVPPSDDAADSGYIPPTTLLYDIIEYLQSYESKYAGVMISSRYYDLVSGYSSIIRPYVRPPPPPPSPSPSPTPPPPPSPSPSPSPPPSPSPSPSPSTSPPPPPRPPSPSPPPPSPSPSPSVSPLASPSPSPSPPSSSPSVSPLASPSPSPPPSIATLEDGHMYASM